MNIIEAPQWLKDQREALRKMPPPTLEQVRAQFKASAEQRSGLAPSEAAARIRKHYGKLLSVLAY